MNENETWFLNDKFKYPLSKKKILIIAPFPPPHTGNSLPVKELYDNLTLNHVVTVLNLNKEKHKAGITSLNRLLKIVNLFWKVFQNQKKNEIVYITVAESVAGNLRDIVFYMILRKRLGSVYIHMLGGANMNKILSSQHRILFRLNKIFIKNLGGVIVEGNIQKQTFSRVINESQIHIVTNFAESSLLISDEEVKLKFEKLDPIRILFLSNMLTGKGHIELIKAFNLLESDIRNQINIDFAGKLVANKAEFLEAVKNSTNIKIHGPVSGNTKKELFAKAHIFCLPTYYPYEGQPFSIIEAYASGCFVITTNHSGIFEIFTPNVNGLLVKKQNVNDLVSVLLKTVAMKHEIYSVGMYNARLAREKFTSSAFCEKMKKVILQPSD